MWTQDDFPGADHVPWQLLIRARFVHEIDAVIASRVVTRLAPALGREKAVRLAAAGTVRRGKEEATDAHIVGALRGLAAWEEGDGICPENWPFRWPPKKKGFEDFDDPMVLAVIDGTFDLLRSGSPALQESLGAALREIART